jgi:hypothetical protein
LTGVTPYQLIYDEEGAFAYVRDPLARLRKPDGPFDGTMLLTAQWPDEAATAKTSDPTETLTPSRFFADLVGAVLSKRL